MAVWYCCRRDKIKRLVFDSFEFFSELLEFRFQKFFGVDFVAQFLDLGGALDSFCHFTFSRLYFYFRNWLKI